MKCLAEDCGLNHHPLHFFTVFPGAPCAPKVESAFKNCINLTWEPPIDDNGTTILGYQLEKRKKDTNQWIAMNPVNEPIEGIHEQEP